MSFIERLDALLAEVPVVAILRGLRCDEAVAVVGALYEAGIRIAEVPLNSPDPFTTIKLLVEQFGTRMLIGAGTVTDPGEVRQLAECGAALCVSPNTNPAVIGEAVRLGLVPLPGCATATEAFAALAAGARHLKFFPAGSHEGDIAALGAVLPKHVTLLAVGGVGPASVPALRKAGISAFGIGADIYKPGRSAADVGARASAVLRAIRNPLTAQLLANPAAAIGESPLALADGTICWTDPVTRRLLDFVDGKVEERPADRAIWSLAQLPGGGIVGTCEDGFCAVADDGTIAAGPAATLDPGCRFNDMAVDPAGGLWAAVMHKGVLATRGSIYHVSSLDAEPKRVAHGLGVPNGMAFAADGRTLFVIDTLARTLLAYPADPQAGALGEPVILSDFMGLPGKPDGMTLAPDGSFWVAMWGGGCVAQLAPDGALLRTIAVRAPNISSAVLHGDTLFVTTSRMRMSEAQIEQYPGAGGLFAIPLAN